MPKLVNKPNSSTHDRGALSEERALSFLSALSYELMERNFRFRGGEIDLVMRSADNVLVFVEVRSSYSLNSPWLRLSIGKAKQERLLKTIHTYFHRRPRYSRLPRRFDIIWIDPNRIEHWKNVIIW